MGKDIAVSFMKLKIFKMPINRIKQLKSVLFKKLLVKITKI